MKTNVFGGILESACLSNRVCVCVSVCVQNTTFCQGTGEGTKSHFVTVLVLKVFISSHFYQTGNNLFL